MHMPQLTEWLQHLSTWFSMDGCGMLYACGIQRVLQNAFCTNISFIMESVNIILLILNCTFIFLPIFVHTWHKVFFSVNHQK